MVQVQLPFAGAVAWDDGMKGRCMNGWDLQATAGRIKLGWTGGLSVPEGASVQSVVGYGGVEV